MKPTGKSMNFSRVEAGSVIIEHHSTSSTVSVTLNEMELDENHQVEIRTRVLWMDYSQFDDLRQAIDNITLIQNYLNPSSDETDRL